MGEEEDEVVTEEVVVGDEEEVEEASLTEVVDGEEDAEEDGVDSRTEVVVDVDEVRPGVELDREVPSRSRARRSRSTKYVFCGLGFSNLHDISLMI